MNRPDKGRLITLEGVEGAGKSTQLEPLCAIIEDAGHTVLRTREPGGTPLAEAIRGILLDGEGMPPMTELLLMFAARSAHFTDRILPALERGDWVVCDRFVDASYAYQGSGRGIETGAIAALESMVLGDRRPDLVLLFDLPVETGLARARSRGEENRFEQEDISFMQRVRDCYLRRAQTEPARYVVIDASDEQQAVSTAVQQAIMRLIKHV